MRKLFMDNLPPSNTLIVDLFFCSKCGKCIVCGHIIHAIFILLKLKPPEEFILYFRNKSLTLRHSMHFLHK